jgi:hypothetical protein
MFFPPAEDKKQGAGQPEIAEITGFAKRSSDSKK